MFVSDIPEQLNAASVFIDVHMDEGRSDRPAILCGERTVSYGDLHENVNRFGNVLQGLDIRMEERVAILLPDVPEFAFTFFGTIKAGAVAIPLNTLMGPTEYEYLLNDSRARLLVVHASLLDAVLPIRGKLKYLKHIIVCGGEAEGLPGLEELLKGASPLLDAVDTSREDVALWLYSSGTTGLPKGIVHRHQDMIVAAEQYAKQTLGLNETDVSFSVPRLFFAYGLGNSLYFPLWTGGTSVLLPEKPTPEAIFQIIDRYQPTVFYSVPTNYTVLLQTAEREGRESLGRIRMCMSAAEPLPKPLFGKWRERFGLEILEGIGSTEALHIFISNRDGKAKAGSTGQLVPGYEAKIVDDDGNELPTGERGTLLIRGDSITTGYWNRQERTKQTLLGEWCNTRDKFRVDEEGFYYYVGRDDDMMKIGGEWVSPNDIEAVLREHPSVLETGVTGVAEEGIITPVAYVALKGGYSRSSELALELQDFVRENSAPHNYACWIEFIDEVPKTTVDKIQRSELLGMEKKQSTAFVEALEKTDSVGERRDKLIAYVQEQAIVAFGLDESKPISPQASFFDLGMDSLAAVALRNRLQIGLGRQLSSAALFKYSTLDTLTDHIIDELLKPGAAGKETQGPADAYEQALPQLIARPEQRSEPFPLTDIQLAYLFGRGDTFLGNVATHWYTEIDCDYDDAELARFNEGWQRLIERQDMLRAVMLPDGRQHILEEAPQYVIRVTDLIDQPEEIVQAKLAEIRERMSHQILDPYSWPIFEIQATRLDRKRTRLHVGLDLLIMDAWSMFLIFRELHDIIHNPEALSPLEITFRDYVMAEEAFRETEHYRQAQDYWFARLDNLPPVAELPMTVMPAVLDKHQFTHRTFTLPADVWRRLQDRAAKFSLTPSGLLLAVFAEVLTIWSKSPHFVINITLFSRLPLHRQINDVVGDFTSLLLLEVNNTVPESFVHRASRIQQQLLQDLDHNAIHGVRVLRELARRQGGNQRAAMPVVFSSTLGLGSLGSDMSSVSQFGEIVYTVSQTPQVWLDYQIFENKGELILNWDCIEELFPAGLLDDMFAAYRRMLELFASDEDAWQRTSFQELLLTDQLAQRAAVNDTGGPVSPELLHDFFVARAIEQPDAPAVITSGRTLSYGELLDLAKRTAHWLQRRDVAPNTLVGVVMEKGWEQIVAVLGILMAGGAYLPIDAHLPAARRNTLLTDGEARVALTQPKFENLEWPDGVEGFTITEEALAREEASVAETMTGPEDLAYVLYTSGSTGQPKGVMLPHRGPVNTILDVNRRFGVTKKDRAICLSALNFDLSVYDVFGVLAAGGALVIPEHEGLRDPAHWRALMAEHGVTLWNSVPALKQMLVEHLESCGESVPPDMRLVMMSGDWIPVDLPGRIRDLWPEMTIVGLGGPTEASIWNNHYVIEEVDPDWNSIPYGKPLTNQFFQVLDVNLEPRPVWVPGELYIGGLGLAKGYWNDPEKTEERFITHPGTGERLYKSGDLARYLPDGNLEILGRSDFQVKIRGHRIELKEIEAVLSEHAGVKEAVVTAVGDERNLEALAAYIVPTEAGQSANEALDPTAQEGVILDPVKRLEFKLNLPGLRPLTDDAVEVPMAVPESDEAPWLARQSYREYLQGPIARDDFARLLSCLGSIQREESPLPKYRYPSAGSLYPVQCYLYVKPGRVEALEGGIYYYHPVRRSLVLLSHVDDIGDGVFAGNDAAYSQAAFAIFLIADQSAMEPMYADWSERFSMLEAGHMGQLLMEVSPRYEIGLCPIGGLDFSLIENWFGLGEQHRLLYTFLGGGIELEQTRALMRQATKPVSISDELTEYASGKLPSYMVPDTIMLLDTLPLTPNGKIDRKALPAPKLSVGSVKTELIPPDSDLEKSLVGIWAELLNHENIGIHDNFFEVGGNSLLVVKLQSELRSVLGKEIPVTKLFQYTTIHALAQHLGEDASAEQVIQNKAAKRHGRRGSAKQRKQSRQKHRATV